MNTQAMREKLSPEKRLPWDIVQYVHNLDAPPGEKVAALVQALAFLTGLYIDDAKDIAEVAEQVKQVVLLGAKEAKKISDRTDAALAADPGYVEREMRKMGFAAPETGDA